jgi:hypothetical protein
MKTSKYTVLGVRVGATGLGSYVDPESTHYADGIEEVELATIKMQASGNWISIFATDKNGVRVFPELEVHLGKRWK